MDDWSQYLSELARSGLAYAWFALLAVWGGTASYLSRMRKKSLPFSLAELIGEWSISGFSGVITALICVDYGVSLEATAAASGIAGHLGGRGVAMLEGWLGGKIKAMVGR